SDVVNLRGLTVVGTGSVGQGIVFTGPGTLNIQNCAIRGFPGHGLLLLPHMKAQFNVSDTIVSESSITIIPHGTSTVRVVFYRVDGGYWPNDSNGPGGSFNVTIANSSGTNSPGSGIEIDGGSGNPQVTIVSSIIANNDTGFLITPNSTTYLARNTIT